MSFALKLMKSTIPAGRVLGAGWLDNLEIKPTQPPKWGWGLGLSLAI